jgi:6-pyruvoyltetrahydropterin/6-carboxytetrahydropterin synthase
MGYKAYKYSFKLHSAHNLDSSLTEQQAHFHTFQIVLYLNNQNSAFVSYEDVEKIIEDYIKQYEGKYLNDTTSFENINPSVENIGIVFYDHLKTITIAHGFHLLQLEISETPTRVFSISETIMIDT